MSEEVDIFHKALDISEPDKREQFLREKCFGNEKLYLDVSEFVSQALEDNDTFGKYTIIKQIGEGGMGRVYLAEYSEEFASQSFTNRVALKTINPAQKLEKGNTARFLHEIKTLAELNHPYIAKFLNIGKSEKGFPFFTMEYVDGDSLLDYCNKNGLSVEKRILFFSRILDAVSYSHQQGFLHCDIKPNNIMVDRNGTPKVIDFGIASKYGNKISDQDSHTSFLQHAFTLEYASPEQISGERKLTAATDIYSLGVVFYELLTGQLPIEYSKEANYKEIISESEKKQPLSLRKVVSSFSENGENEKIWKDRDCESLPELKRKLTTELDEIVQKAISKKIPSRYENAEHFNTQIKEFINDESLWKQLKTLFTLLYKRVLRKVKQISIKWAVATFLGLIVLIFALSLQYNLRTIPYFIQIKSSENVPLQISRSQKQALDKSISLLQASLLQNQFQPMINGTGKELRIKNNAWGLSTMIVSLSDSGYPLNQDLLNSILDQEAVSGECWNEEKKPCKLSISGWVLLSKSRLGKPFSNQQLEFLLKNQSQEGWWSSYPDGLKGGDNASTYPTAVIILGLVEHLKSNLIAENDRNKVITSIKKSVLWLLNKSHSGNGTNQWSDCPDQPQRQQTQSVGLDGIVIYTLHSVSKLEEFQTIPNFENNLKQIDSAWLAKFDQFQFPSLENEVGCVCRTTVNDGEILLDTTKQGDIPWAIIASVEAYPQGSDWQKAVINKWLDTFSFSQEYNGFYYGAAEYLIALTHLRRNISS